MKKQNEIAEEVLMKNKSIDELIALKMQEELKNAFKKRVGIADRTKVFEITKVPAEKLFSKKAYYKVFNKETQVQTMVNGLQAEGLIGMQDDTRKKLLQHETDIFSTDNLFVKFEYFEV